MWDRSKCDITFEMEEESKRPLLGLPSLLALSIPCNRSAPVAASCVPGLP